MELDPVKYEMFRHRLYNILEEGRIAIQRVSGSPAVVEGGECMCSFYDSGGTVILTACGLLLHCTGCSDAIRRAIEWYEEDPGIHDGDQFFFNDPYIAGTHVYDMVVIKPIFYGGRRIAWAGAMMHTADTGGVLRGGASEIFHEGICIQGLKVMEGGVLRPEVFRTITEQCRDPLYVGLDLKAKIAANNVCSRAYLEMAEKYGIEFVEAASQRVIADSERMTRARLRSLPDGVWRSRVYNLSYKGGREALNRVVCTMTKEGEEITFDFTGTSPQNEDAGNCAYPCSWSSLFVALAGRLFWNVPWNGGMFSPVRLIVPEGSLLNCRYPAACGRGPWTGNTLSSAAEQCIARMLYAGGFYEDINASWRGMMGGGERGRYGGHNQHGGVVAQQIYDWFAGGLGAAPYRDGVHTGADILNPESSISDVELVEMNYPLLYLCRNHLPDSPGPGRYRGGLGLERIMLVYGSQNFSDNYGALGTVPSGGGLFGGYASFAPGAVAGSIIFRGEDTKEKLKKSPYPATFAELERFGLEVLDPNRPFARIPLREYDVLADCGLSGGGSGYGDPLDRPPEQVAEDLRNQVVSISMAESFYGVVLDPKTGEPDPARTEHRRKEIREERLRQGRRWQALTTPQG